MPPPTLSPSLIDLTPSSLQRGQSAGPGHTFSIWDSMEGRTCLLGGSADAFWSSILSDPNLSESPSRWRSETSSFRRLSRSSPASRSNMSAIRSRSKSTHPKSRSHEALSSEAIPASRTISLVNRPRSSAQPGRAAEPSPRDHPRGRRARVTRCCWSCCSSREADPVGRFPSNRFR